MTGKAGRPRQAAGLRQQAEEMARQRAARSPEKVEDLSPEEVRRLLHELRVHQIELEMQNEELRHSQVALDTERARYFDLYDLAPVGYVTISETGLILEANLTAAKLLGVARRALTRKPFSRFILHEDQDKFYRFRRLLLEKGEPLGLELRMVKNAGATFRAQLDAATTQDPEGPGAFRIIVSDITERKLAEESVEDILEKVDEGFLLLDRDLRIQFANRAYVDQVKMPHGEIIGQPCFKVSRYGDKPCQESGAECVVKQVLDTGAASGPVLHTRHDANNDPVFIEVKAFPLSKNSQGEVQTVILRIADITEKQTRDLEIRRLAFLDPLTHLPNRRLLSDRLEQAISSGARSGLHSALLVLDLDHFKALNDTRGHDAGDLLLIEAGRRLQAAVREGDTVARLGGDEFAVLLHDLAISAQEAIIQAGQVCKKLRASLSLPYDLAGFEYHLTASIGASLFRGHETTAEDTFKHTDVAMYQAKTGGRNCIRFFDRDMQAKLEESTTLVDDLSRAIQGRQLELYYQPQIDNERRVVGAEALLRWTHPRHGPVSPLDFIPLADETGSMQHICNWVLQTACERLQAWSAMPTLSGLRLAVNVSPRQCSHPAFVDDVLRILQRTGINPARLIIELTERQMLDNLESAIRKMLALKTVGIHFSMDDFGTGCSSLSCIRKLPLDQLKIDGSFIRELTTDPDGDALVRTIIAMGRGLGLGVIAEGVETAEQLTFLTRHGCNAYQGYLFGSPVSSDKFERSLLDGHEGSRG